MSTSGTVAVAKIPRGFEGLIRGATLADLVQMECLAMTTTAVRIDRGEQSGHIFFSRGQVVHAETGGLRGEAALTELIGWPDGSFSIEEGIRPYEETITRHWQSLLIEAVQLNDEMRSDLPATPPPMSNSTMSTRSKINETALREVFNDPEVQSAAYFSGDEALIDGKSDTADDLHITFSYVVQLARLIGESLGAENLQEIQIIAPEYRSLCVLSTNETVALMTTAKANLTALSRKLN
jgi:hypothetical protein